MRVRLLLGLLLTSFATQALTPADGGGANCSILEPNYVQSDDVTVFACTHPSTTTFNCTWTKPAGYYAIALYRDGVLIRNDTGASVSYNDTDAGNTANSAHTFFISALQHSGTGECRQWSGGLSIVFTPRATPSAPALSATGGTVTVTPTLITGVVSYDVYRNGSLRAAAQTGASFTDSTVAGATTYTYAIVENYADNWTNGPTGISNSVTTAPSAPTLSVVPSDQYRHVSLSWTAPAGASSYHVWRSLDGSSYADLGDVGSGTTYDATGLGADNYTFYFTVTAMSYGTPSSPSNAVNATTAPAIPGTPAITGNTYNTLSATWGGSSGASSYATYANGAANITPSAANGTLTGLSPNTSYTITVKAVRGSTYSNASAGTATTTLPGAPTSFVETGVTGATTTHLSWSAPSGGANTYSVTKSDGSDTGGAGCTSVGGTSCVLVGLNPSTVYSLVVRAENGSGRGIASNTITVTTPAPLVPSAPTVGTVSDVAVTLNWTSTGADSYTLKRGGTPVTGCTGVSVLSCTDSTVSPDTTYTYTVSATYSYGTSADSGASASVLTRMATPTGFSATSTPSEITLHWGSVSGATSYAVSRGGAASVSVATSTYVDGTVASGVTYPYVVQAFRSGNSSPSSSAYSVNTNLATVSGFQVDSKAQTSVTVSALSVVGHTLTFTKYDIGGEITWCSYAGSGSRIACTDNTAATNTAFIYYAYDFNGSVTSAPAMLVVYTYAGPVTTMNATSSIRSMALSWADTGATFYKVYRGSTLVYAAGGTSFTDTGLSDYTRYLYRVDAANMMGQAVTGTSVWSPFTAPAAPVGFTVSGAQDGYLLTWTNSTGSAAYQVRYAPSWTLYSTPTTSPITASFTGACVSKTFSVTPYNTDGLLGSSSTAAGGTLPYPPTITDVSAGPPYTITFTPVSQPACGSPIYALYRDGVNVASQASAAPFVDYAPSGAHVYTVKTVTSSYGTSLPSNAVSGSPAITTRGLRRIGQ